MYIEGNSFSLFIFLLPETYTMFREWNNFSIYTFCDLKYIYIYINYIEGNSFPLYTFLWPEDGSQWSKHVVVRTTNKTEDSCVLTYTTPSLKAKKYSNRWVKSSENLRPPISDKKYLFSDEGTTLWIESASTSTFRWAPNWELQGYGPRHTVGEVPSVSVLFPLL